MKSCDSCFHNRKNKGTRGFVPENKICCDKFSEIYDKDKAENCKFYISVNDVSSIFDYKIFKYKI